MKPYEILSNNKLIAEFMGWSHNVKYDLWYSPGMLDHEPLIEATQDEKLKFNSSWDWLMPVVDKIDNLGFEIEIVNNRCAIGTYMAVGEIMWHSEEESDTSRIEAVYKAVVEFIKQHNKGEYSNV